MEALAQTPLHAWHVAHGGRMVDFAGWSMPVQYTGIVQEHHAVRNAVGLFDISHMGRLRFSGEGALDLLNWLVTKDVSKLKQGRIRYGLVTNEQGGILDDVLVYALQDGAGQPYFLVVVNASNRQKIVGRIEERLAQQPVENLHWDDLTTQWSMIAVQGPAAREVLDPFVEIDLGGMKYYTGVESLIDGHGGIVSRTGYTGEDGFEVILGANVAADLWEKLLSAGASQGAMACGLGARDTLRLEAAMPLYGHELNEDINPYQAGLNFAVDLDKETPFAGQEALRKLKEDNTQPVRIGLEVEGKRIPREEYPIAASAERLSDPVGKVTSGTFSPTLEKAIAMGYVQPEHAKVGTPLAVDIRGRAAAAKVVELPFYQRKK